MSDVITTITNERALIAGVLTSVAEALADGSVDETNVLIVVAFAILRFFVQPAHKET